MGTIQASVHRKFSCPDCVGYPAAYSTVIAVSATTKDDLLADFSSTGPEVELAAPGKDVLSTVPPESSSDGTATFSGTSMASPHVAGTGGLLMAEGQSNTDARSTLQDTAEDIGLGDNEQGYGLVDAEAATKALSSDPSPTVDSLSASEVETADDDAEFDVSWSVSDDEDDLDTVDVYLLDSDDNTEDSKTGISVSGSSDSGETRLVASGDEGTGNSYTVELTVTDSNDNSTTDSVAVSETEDTPTVDSLSLSEDEDSDSDADFDADWSVSDADGDLDTLKLTLYELKSDGTRGEEEDSASPSVSGGSASGITDLVASGDDGTGNTYEVEAVVSDTDGTTSSATATATESENSAPDIDTFDVSSQNPNNPHAEIAVDWAVSDADGNLDTVKVVVDDTDESETFSSTSSVSGGSASGTDEFKDKFDSGEYDVTLTVTDTDGHSTSDTKTITA